ncbi:sigma 54-interacting transcriptional regulator [Sphingosinicella sp. LHD-64]|uniref:sigma-54 interaction domain-containing protein n=1 Tax=Sphingosinicella sp. LHD-64 TaxID=3072139 RepID=UPI00280DB709|nr:sigma 54-interacting transcriptional regulator [Sphingosinicella sp. LHD-64]MDQ8757170.1 sigma 54-interacting transcriptional regulator [Sphingosinicella sp. LHD-64]
MIGLSDKAAEANPALAAWLDGCGLAVTLFRASEGGRTAGPAIYARADAAQATGRDVVIDFGAAPTLVRATAATPALLAYGYEDLAFGNALVAELVRPAFRPAAGEPESAATLIFAARIAASDASVLLLGETGTGKEGMARYIHAVSPRASGPFTAVNCAALPETMLEAILFGHRKGSFTGASGDGEGLFRAADGGTLLLDEIAEIPLSLQAKLLRALQEREILPVGAVRPEPIDVRIIACANRDLAAEVEAGRFRADLYWRLNVVPVNLSPLRARRLDIRAIAAAMLLRHTPAGMAMPFPTAAALDRLMNHAWPGNCRELENVIQRALLLHSGERIHAPDLIIDRAATAPEAAALSLGAAARSAEADAIRAALDEAGGHRLRAARRLGISERTLRYRLAEMRAVAA